MVTFVLPFCSKCWYQSVKNQRWFVFWSVLLQWKSGAMFSTSPKTFTNTLKTCNQSVVFEYEYINRQLAFWKMPRERKKINSIDIAWYFVVSTVCVWCVIDQSETFFDDQNYDVIYLSHKFITQQKQKKISNQNQWQKKMWLKHSWTESTRQQQPKNVRHRVLYSHTKKSWTKWSIFNLCCSEQEQWVNCVNLFSYWTP